MKSFFSIITIFVLTGFSALADTITINTNQYFSTTLSNPKFWAATNTQIFTYYGLPVTNYSVNGGSGSGASAIGITVNPILCPPVQVAFDFIGTNFEMKAWAHDYVGDNAANGFFVIDDGATLTTIQQSALIWPNGGGCYIPISFSSNIVHHLKMTIKGTFEGINVAAGNTITNTILPKQNLLIVEGDSYTEGFNPSTIIFGQTSYWLDSWVFQLAHLVPNTIGVPSGVGGTGFGTNNLGLPRYQDRVVSDICTLYTNAVNSGKYNQIFITASGTINDLDQNTNLISTAATSVYTTIQKACPTAHLFFVGDALGIGGRSYPLGNDYALDGTYSQVATQMGVPYYSQIAANIVNASTYSTYFGGGDLVHPCHTGYGMIAAFLNSGLTATYGTNWNSGVTNWTPYVQTVAPSNTNLSVTDYGAKGDCQQVWASTASNSAVVTFANALTSADIGKTIELFGVGAATSGGNHQDLIAIIANVVNGTNVYLSGDIPSITSNGVYCVYGTNNAYAFQAAVDAANGTNTIITIPAGNYLLIPPCQYTNFDNGQPYPNYMAQYALQAVSLRKGGLKFQGSGREQTVLTGCGAWKNQGGYCLRGLIFTCSGPIANDYPVVWKDMTFDGGLQAGYIADQTYPPDFNTGLGWDGTSAACLDDGSEPLNIYKEFNNCRFQHFRGEMIKGSSGSAGSETILVTNCVFTDGNATAFNYNFAHTIAGCVFSNMLQIEEFYLKYPTNAPSNFVNNYATNIYHNFVSLNGGTATNLPYVIANNVFCQNGGNGIQTTPACNVTISNNQFLCSGYSVCVALGVAGYQGFCNNSNILISGNSFVNPAIILEIAGATSPTDQNGVQNVLVTNNTLYASSGTPQALLVYNWCTNVQFAANDFYTHATGAYNVYFTSGANNSQYVTIDTNNIYKHPYYNYTGTPQTSVLYYGAGPRTQTTHNTAGDIFVLQDNDAPQIPQAAKMIVDNSSNDGAGSYTLYLNSAMTRSMPVANGQTVVCYWNNGAWTTNAPATSLTNSVPTAPAPPTNLHPLN